jgi:chorismate-pyruvate lyase
MSDVRDQTACARSRELVTLFHDSPLRFGECHAVSSAGLPEAARQLLDHTSHMTVAMEQFHGEPVTLRVVSRTDSASGRYAREILLGLGDGRVVQHGIVRIDLGTLPRETAAAIRAESVPLGRILLQAGLLCTVHDVQLLRIVVGPHLAALFGIPLGTETYGRVATIGLGGQPVIELLEISAPVSG